MELPAPVSYLAPCSKNFLDRPVHVLRGGTLKAYEDALDALLCAFIAAHYWCWGAERNEMIGTMSGGYIVTPSKTFFGLPWSFDRPTREGTRPAAGLANTVSAGGTAR